MPDDSVPVSRIARKALERMAASTVGWERANQNGRPLANRRPVSRSTGIWAKTKEGEEGKYSWIAMKPNEDGELEEDEDWGSGDHTKDEGYAVEIRYGSEYVLEGSIVWLMPASGQNFYVFDYVPGTQWVKSSATINFPARDSQEPGEGTLKFMELDEDGHFAEGQEMKVFNGYKDVVELSSSKLAQVDFGLEGKWWIVGADC